MAEKPTALYSPRGEKYETSSRAEATRLRALGYTEKKPTPKQVDAAGGPPEKS